jgi:ketosteroid isomerase-like protein
MNVERRNDLIETYFTALDEAEYEPLREAFAPDVRYLYPGGEHLEGLDETMEYFETRRPTKRSEHTITRRYHTEEVSVTEGHFTGEVPGTGPIRADFCNVFEFDDAEERITYNGVYMRPEDRGY